MNRERERAGHDSHCVSLQSIGDVFCSFLAHLITGQVKLCECLHECDDDESVVREIAMLGSKDE